GGPPSGASRRRNSCCSARWSRCGARCDRVRRRCMPALRAGIAAPLFLRSIVPGRREHSISRPAAAGARVHGSHGSGRHPHVGGRRGRARALPSGPPVSSTMSMEFFMLHPRSSLLSFSLLGPALFAQEGNTPPPVVAPAPPRVETPTEPVAGRIPGTHRYNVTFKTRGFDTKEYASAIAERQPAEVVGAIVRDLELRA